MKLGKREAIFLGLLMAIPLAAWWFDFKPTAQAEEFLRDEIGDKQSKLQALNRTTAVIGDLHEEIDSLSEAIGYFNSRLPDRKEIDKVLREVWTLAESSDLRARRVQTENRSRPTPGLGDDAYATQPIQVELEGDFLGVYPFLQALENQPRIMRVAELKISKLQRDSPDGQVAAALTMHVFFENSKD